MQTAEQRLQPCAADAFSPQSSRVSSSLPGRPSARDPTLRYAQIAQILSKPCSISCICTVCASYICVLASLRAGSNSAEMTWHAACNWAQVEPPGGALRRRSQAQRRDVQAALRLQGPAFARVTCVRNPGRDRAAGGREMVSRLLALHNTACIAANADTRGPGSAASTGPE